MVRDWKRYDVNGERERGGGIDRKESGDIMENRFIKRCNNPVKDYFKI